MKRILVTGGAGFIGSHLCERLLREGHDVICMDNYFTGSKDNIRHLLENDHFELVRHDIIEPYHAEVDEIYNLACPASPVHYQYNPIKTLKTSVMGAINMLGLAKRTKAKILQASTSEVYGDPMVHPQVETYWGNDDFTGPVNTGNPDEFTMLELAERVIRLTGSKSEIVFNPLPSDDPKQRKPDISLATRRLGGWSPSVELERGLQKTIEYFKSIIY